MTTLTAKITPAEAKAEVKDFIDDLQSLKNDVIGLRASSPKGSPEKAEARYISERMERALQNLREIVAYVPKVDA